MILVKEGFILTSGFIRSSDQAIIPARNVTIKTGVDEPVLLDELEIARLFGQAASQARVEKLSTDDIDNMTIDYDQFIKDNQLEVHEEGQIVDIEYIGQDPKYLNPNVVEQYLFTQGSYLLISSSVFIREFIDDLEKQLTLSLEDKQDKQDAITQINDKDLNPLGDIVAGTPIIEGNKIPTRKEVQQPIDVLKNEIDNNKVAADSTEAKVVALEPKVTATEAGVEDYFDNKANFALISDQDSTKQVDLSALSWTQNGNNVELDISGLDFTGFVATEKVEIKTTNADETVFVEDSFNDASRGKNEIHIAGDDQSIYVTATDQQILIEGLGAQQRLWFVASTPQYIEQKGKVQAGTVDTVARAAAVQAQAKANSVDAKAGANIVAIAAINVKLLTFQTSSDAALKGANTVVAAINANYDLLARYGSIKVSGGDLGTTAETLATETHVSEAIKDKVDNDEVFLKTDYEEKEITIPASIANVNYSTNTDTKANDNLLVLGNNETITSINFGTKSDRTYRKPDNNKNIWRIYDLEDKGFVRISDQLEIELVGSVFKSILPAGSTGGITDVEMNVNTTKTNSAEQSFNALVKK